MEEEISDIQKVQIWLNNKLGRSYSIKKLKAGASNSLSFAPALAITGSLLQKALSYSMGSAEFTLPTLCQNPSQKNYET